MDKMKDTLNDQHHSFYNLYQKTKGETDENFKAHYRKLRELKDENEKHQTILSELKDFKEFQVKINDKTDDKIKKNKATSWDDLLKVKDELGTRIEEIDKNHIDFTE